MFLPGRNIHHNLLLLSEMLHQAHASGEEHILLKLDVHKVFDRLEWKYVPAAVAKAGMGGTLSAFLQAGFSLTLSFILINGRPTGAVKLTRFVRQRCPLSPLIFILAFDTLSLMLSDAVSQGALAGVDFPRLGVNNVQSFFADDVGLITRDVICYILECQRLLLTMGPHSV